VRDIDHEVIESDRHGDSCICLTFDMSGGLPLAQPAVRRPLDGGVRRHFEPLR
jgi:hypothetical protein